MMIKLPTTKPISDSERLAALDAITPATTAAISQKTASSKPWLDADPSKMTQHATRMNGTLAAKLEYIYKNAEGRPSKNELVCKAVEAFADQWLKEHGLL